MAVYVALICTAGFLLAHFVVQRTVVRGSSMAPTLLDGDNLIVDRTVSGGKRLKRYDVVVFTYLYRPETYFIKRIIGLPGETVQIKDNGSIYINGRKLSENYGNAVIEDPGTARYPLKLGEGEYFVLGDNRNNSEDSRFLDVGPIKSSQIVGKVLFRFFPPGRFGTVEQENR